MKWIIVQTVAVLLALSAATVSFNLLAKHLTGSSSASWFEAGCSADENSGRNCAAVLASRWSYWPPRTEDENDTGRGVPVALLGLAYYAALAVWLLAVGRPSPARRWIHLLLLGFMACGLASSAFFTYIMLTKLDQWCPWCLVTHILNLIIALLVFWMLPRKKTTPQTLDAKSVAPQPVHPSWRLVLVTLLAIYLVSDACYQVYAKTTLRKQAAADERGLQLCKAAYTRLTKDPNLFVAQWQMGAAYDIPIRPDDPIRTEQTAALPAWDLVVFSDLQCPVCARVAGLLDAKLMALFDGNLRIIFKHYPIHKDCNPVTTATMHPYACGAARLAEAARVLGGNEAFWEVHDHIYGDRSILGPEQAMTETIAAHLGLDAARLAEAAHSPAVDKRIREDARLAREVGVTATPALFLNGRRVDALAVRRLDFWDKVADRYWKSVGVERPAGTRRAATKPTRGTPGRKDAP